MSDKAKLFWLNLVVKKRNFVEFIKVIGRYYSNLTFMKIDLVLLSKYIFKSPFKINKEFLQSRGEEDVYAYGETPLTTLELIAKTCQISQNDTLFELGCGRGRGCFWLNCFIKCHVVGIEYVPSFVEFANQVKEQFELKGVDFIHGDILTEDYTGATVIYLYGTCYEEPFIKKLIEKFSKLPSGTKIITVSYPLSDYTDKPLFQVLKRFPAQFTWGEGDVYLQSKN